MKLADKLLGLSRAKKRALAIATDAVICAWTAWAAHYLRLEEWVWLNGNQWLTVVVSVALAIPIFIRGGLYRMIFRHTGWPAMLAVTRACLVYGALYALIFTFISFPGVPRTVGLIQPILLFLAIGASRALAHYFLGGNYRRILDDDAQRVLVYGAGVAGRQLAEAVKFRGGMNVIGFLDDDRSLHGALVMGLPVYDPDQVVQIAARHEISDLLLALPSASRRRRREIVARMLPLGVNVRTLPGLADIAQGHVEITDMRPVEIEDLLGRDPVEPDQALLEGKVRGKVVLVTGGGGSIGSELCRQILAVEPQALLIVDSSEFALYTIHRELEHLRRTRGAHDIQLVPLLAGVQDEARMRAIFAGFRPETIYHAAAYKHVPLVEHNVLEGIKNNVLGTLGLTKLAIEFGVVDLVLISTDKAVRPTNIMGATKRLAEMVLQAYSQVAPETRFSMVRFGNVLGSSGSVLPVFREQIKMGGPITITHREVTRYFMTVREAAQLVIQASAMASGGEVFVLEMGESVQIYDMAVAMIELSGLKLRDDDHPDGDIQIEITGLRPGEKLYEELLIGENPIATRHERIMQAREGFVPLSALEPMLERLSAAVRESSVERSVTVLKALVPEYRSESGVVDWLAHSPTGEVIESSGNAAVAGRIGSSAV
jgi:FlaA1/EpsC-like NDP-sugar epimerase